MIISDFNSAELNYLLTRCNFVNYEKEIFLGRAQGQTLEEIAERIGISYDYARKLSQKVNKKIMRSL